jgi:hypothetical protein
MASTIYGVPLGRLKEALAKLETPERWAYKCGLAFDSTYTLKRWTNRPALARSIRMQQRGPARGDHWRAVVELDQSEGW